MNTSDYKQWLADLKSKIRQSQIKAAVKVNTELLKLYWELGQDIVSKQMESSWGSGFFKQLSKDLRSEFPHLQGFSSTNLKYCKRFYLFYSQDQAILQQVAGKLQPAIRHQLGGELQVSKNQQNIIRPQLVDELENNILFKLPWGHHREIITKCKIVKEALFYVQKTIENGWSRAVLMNFMEADLYSVQGKALNNFSRLLPAAQSDLAGEILKDPYNFDFITLTEPYKERELEDVLTDHITKFLVELGQGFAYVGRQYQIKIGENDRFIDLLFYHLKLRCYVVIELKAVKFEPEFTGKLGYYVSAVNHQLKMDVDNPTIGILICKTKDDIDVQYSLESSSQPIGISEYQFSKILPDNFKSVLPSIKEIEEELKSK